MSNCNRCSERKFAQIDQYIDALPTQKGALIDVLNRAQGIYGYLPSELQLHIAKRLGIPASHVYGVVSFYSFFTMVPKGQCKISLCLGTACFVCGAEAVMQEFMEDLKIGPGETTSDGIFSLDALRCVGACSLAPVVMVNDRVYGKVKPDQVKGIIEEHMQHMAIGGEIDA